MTNGMSAELHADDANLVRWMDGALADDERAALASHLAACTHCSARRAALTRAAERIGGLLRGTDVPTPTTALGITLVQRAEPWPARWRVAAVLTLALASAAAVPPVRAWIVEAAKAAWAQATGSQAPADSTAAEAGAVGFVPAGRVLTIRVPARPTGHLTVEVVGGERVSAAGTGGRHLPGLLVLPDELRIGEDGDSAADYVVRVPARLDSVRIVVGGNAERAFKPSAPGERRTFSLSPRR